jgi:HSP20 family protein
VAFARRDPLGDLLALRQHMDRFAAAPSGWVPAVDLHETDARYVLTAELPGVARPDISVQAAGDRLTIEGTRHTRSGRAERFACVERGHGPFSRTFQLPHPVDAAGITADLTDGVLTVTVPKTAAFATRRIVVS